jgi:hypothetical protein
MGVAFLSKRGAEPDAQGLASSVCTSAIELLRAVGISHFGPDQLSTSLCQLEQDLFVTSCLNDEAHHTFSIVIAPRLPLDPDNATLASPCPAVQ